MSDKIDHAKALTSARDEAARLVERASKAHRRQMLKVNELHKCPPAQKLELLKLADYHDRLGRNIQTYALATIASTMTGKQE